MTPARAIGASIGSFTGAPGIRSSATAAALRVPPERWSAARAALAPAGASAIRLCRYSGLNARPRLFMPGQVLTLLGTPYARDGLIAFAQGPMGAARGTPLWVYISTDGPRWTYNHSVNAVGYVHALAGETNAQRVRSPPTACCSCTSAACG